LLVQAAECRGSVLNGCGGVNGVEMDIVGVESALQTREALIQRTLALTATERKARALPAAGSVRRAEAIVGTFAESTGIAATAAAGIFVTRVGWAASDRTVTALDWSCTADTDSSALVQTVGCTERGINSLGNLQSCASQHEESD